MPVTPEHLQQALTDECVVADATLPKILRHRHIGDLALPSGRLVACDPVTSSGTMPFPHLFPHGTFPVFLSLAQWCYWDEPDQLVVDEELGWLVAFALIRFRQSIPVRWEMLTFEDQDITTLKEGEYFGYGVDSAMGGFMDSSVARIISEWPFDENEPAIWDVIMKEYEKNYNNKDDFREWVDMPFGEANLIAFTSGNGDGIYATYAGYDAEGEVAVVVTDFNVL